MSPALLDTEIQNVLSFKHDFDNFQLRASKASHEVTPVYQKDEISLTSTVTESIFVVIFVSVCIRLPESYPLRPVEVECTQRMGVSEGLWRKWMLSVTTLLLTQVIGNHL